FRIFWPILAASWVARAWPAQAALFHREHSGASFECVKQRERPSFSFDRTCLLSAEEKLGCSVENGSDRGFCCRELLQFARRSRTQSSANAESASSVAG